MAGLKADRQNPIKRLYDLALQHGGKCEEEPSLCQSDKFCVVYFRNPDGHKLITFVMSSNQPMSNFGLLAKIVKRRITSHSFSCVIGI